MSNLAKLISSGLDHLKHQLRNSERCLVFTKNTAGEMVVRAVHNFESACIWQSGFMHSIVLETAMKQKKGVIILDAKQDPKLKHASPKHRNEFRSALCVPLLDGSHNVIGLLYADSSSPGAFTHADLKQAERLGRDIGRQLGPALKQEEFESKSTTAGKPTSEERKSKLPYQVMIIPGALLAVGILWLLLGGILSPRGQATSKPTPKTTKEIDPVSVVSTFLYHIRMKDYSRAYRLMTKRLQSEMPLRVFQSQTSAYIGVPSHRYELEKRHASTGQQGKTMAIVYIDFVSKKGTVPEKRWTWTLVKAQKTWKIDKFDGGPFGRH